MAEDKNRKFDEMQKKQQLADEKQAQKRQQLVDEKLEEKLVRIYGYDMPGRVSLMVGLLNIKGVSWAISNAVCIKIAIPKSKKISDLSKDEIKKIEDFLDTLEIPEFMKNRRNDPENATSTHLYGNDLDLKKDFDIKKLKKIKSYRGLRHSLGLPSRGQRTKSHFRTKGRSAVGVKRKK